MEMRQETEYYRQQLELENLRQELRTLRGSPHKPVLPSIAGGMSHFGNNQQILQPVYHHHQQHQQMIGQPLNEVCFRRHFSGCFLCLHRKYCWVTYTKLACAK